MQIYLVLSLKSKWFVGSCHIKFLLVETFIVSNNIDIFCISKAFLCLPANNIYDESNIKGYNFLWTDRLSNVTCGGVAIYYKDPAPNPGKTCVRLSDPAPSDEILTKTNFAVKSLKKGSE